MSLYAAPPGRRGDAARELTIDLEELIWALNSRDPQGLGPEMCDRTGRTSSGSALVYEAAQRSLL